MTEKDVMTNWLPKDNRDGCGGYDGQLGDYGRDEGGGRHIIHQVEKAQVSRFPPAL